MKNFKKVLCLVLALLTAFVFTTAAAASDGDSGLVYKYYNKSYRITGCSSSYSGNVIIPEKYNDGTNGEYPVTAISSGAFNGANLAAVRIPATVTSCGDRAFADCRNLESARFDGSNCSLGVQTFSGCMKLASVTLPSQLTNIPDETFNGCIALGNVNIPSTVTEIGEKAFSLSGIKKLDISASVYSIGVEAFSACSSLTAINVSSANTEYKDINGVLFTHDGKTLMQYPCAKSGTSYTIPSGVESIGKMAFGKAALLTSVTFPSTVKKIGEYAFSECFALKDVKLNKGLSEIGNMSFQQCKALKEITIPSTVTVMNDVFFMSGLETVIIESGVTKIGKKAFEKCTSLKNVTIPKTVTSIGSGAFDGCTSLKSLFIPTSVSTIDANAFYAIEDSITLKVVKDSAAQKFAKANSIKYETVELYDDVSLRIKTPSTNIIKYGDTLILHISSNIPQGCKIVWTSDSSAVEIKPAADGKTCSVTSTAKGTATITATLVGADGNTIINSEQKSISDTSKLTSKAGIFQKIISFFKNLFGINRIIAE